MGTRDIVAIDYARPKRRVFLTERRQYARPANVLD